MQIETAKIIEILHFIKPYEEIEIETDLFEEGILDSLSLLIFITRLEEEYKVTISIEKLKREDFCSVNKIRDFLKKM